MLYKLNIESDSAIDVNLVEAMYIQESSYPGDGDKNSFYLCFSDMYKFYYGEGKEAQEKAREDFKKIIELSKK